MTSDKNIIEEAYNRYFSMLVAYATRRINNVQEAEDIVQNAFVRLLGYEVITPETVKSLCFTVVSNLVTDHIRRHYKHLEVHAYMYDEVSSTPVLTPEQVAVFHDIAERESCMMLTLPPAMRRVYEMTRIEGNTISEIAEKLNISTRTVECHQFKARKLVREGLRRII